MPPWTLPILAFLCGSIPFSYLIGRAKGTDIRTVGSGNVGATNLGRVYGRNYFLLGFGLDMLKGLAPVLVSGWALGALGWWTPSTSAQCWWLACVIAAMLGHVFTPWLGFKGGKGVSTGLGALLGVFPTLTAVGLSALAVFLLVLAIWRYVSLAAISGAVSLPFLLGAWLLLASARGWEGVAGPDLAWRVWPYVLACVGIGLFVPWTHRSNIRRLWAGVEPRMGQRLKPQVAASDAQEPSRPTA